MTSKSPTAVRQHFRDAAGAFVEVVARLGPDDWAKPGLGVWTVRDLAGHASRALSTAESYLDGARTWQEPELRDAMAYFRAAADAYADPASVAERGRQAGAALGEDPHASVSKLTESVLALGDATPDDALVTSPAGTMTLPGSWPTRTSELVVHGLDLAGAAGAPPPAGLAAPLRASLALATELAAVRGDAGDVLLALTGRRALPEGFSVL